jgi:chorismate mutase
MTDQLTELRASLDRLDDEMIVLLEQRFQISGKVAAAKNGSVTFRPGREAAIVRRLCDAAPQLDRAMLLGIWRHIFTASVAQQEGSLRIAAHENAEATAQWHFANGTGLAVYDDLVALFAALPDQIDYILVPCSEAVGIAAHMFANHGLKIVAKTPLFDLPEITPCYIIGTHPGDDSGSDADLYAVRENGVFTIVETCDAPPFDVKGDNVRWIGKVAT